MVFCWNSTLGLFFHTGDCWLFSVYLVIFRIGIPFDFVVLKKTSKVFLDTMFQFGFSLLHEEFSGKICEEFLILLISFFKIVCLS